MEDQIDSKKMNLHVPVPTIMPIIVPVQGLKRKQKLAVEKDMKAESQLTTVEVSRSMPMRKTRFSLV